MAVEMFLKLAGCDGESIATGHTNEIELLGWNWGLTNMGSSSMGGGSGTGKANFHDLSITKYVDKATATILSNCASGKHFDTATLTCRKAGGGAPVPYLVIDMGQVFVSGVQHGGSPGDELTVESVTFNFAEVDVTYKPQNATGAGAGEVPFKWDIRKNQSA
ncbi:Hcp family type VI secretion system effector [Sphingomonas sp. DT-51]|uniref:Hcp family type VI secretion system effector n=1 Tax=Sphingomonas sp. DT-51 TaxID=3396165 RepID=UPI003F1B6A86